MNLWIACVNIWWGRWSVAVSPVTVWEDVIYWNTRLPRLLKWGAFSHARGSSTTPVIDGSCWSSVGNVNLHRNCTDMRANLRYIISGCRDIWTKPLLPAPAVSIAPWIAMEGIKLRLFKKETAWKTSWSVKFWALCGAAANCLYLDEPEELSKIHKVFLPLFCFCKSWIKLKVTLCTVCPPKTK